MRLKIAYFKALFTGPHFQDSAPENLLLILGAFVLFMIVLGKTLTNRRFLEWPLWRQVVVSLILILLIISYADARLDFIYFVF